jgi:hypothetical protein
LDQSRQVPQADPALFVTYSHRSSHAKNNGMSKPKKVIIFYAVCLALIADIAFITVATKFNLLIVTPAILSAAYFGYLVARAPFRQKSDVTELIWRCPLLAKSGRALVHWRKHQTARRACSEVPSPCNYVIYGLCS